MHGDNYIHSYNKFSLICSIFFLQPGVHKKNVVHETFSLDALGSSEKTVCQGLLLVLFARGFHRHDNLNHDMAMENI